MFLYTGRLITAPHSSLRQAAASLELPELCRYLSLSSPEREQQDTANVEVSIEMLPLYCHFLTGSGTYSLQ